MDARDIIYIILNVLSKDNKKFNRIKFWLNRERYLRDSGAKIGVNCRIEKISLPSEPYLIELGNHVSVGENVQFLTHDGGVWVLREMERNDKLDLFGKISVGNNVFIGNNVIMLPNIEIGDNVIIGAGSIVTKDFGSNIVLAGVPARILCHIEDFKRRKIMLCVETKGLEYNEKRDVLNDYFKTM